MDHGSTASPGHAARHPGPARAIRRKRDPLSPSACAVCSSPARRRLQDDESGAPRGSSVHGGVARSPCQVVQADASHARRGGSRPTRRSSTSAWHCRVTSATACHIRRPGRSPGGSRSSREQHAGMSSSIPTGRCRARTRPRPAACTSIRRRSVVDDRGCARTIPRGVGSMRARGRCRVRRAPAASSPSASATSPVSCCLGRRCARLRGPVTGRSPSVRRRRSIVRGTRLHDELRLLRTRAVAEDQGVTKRGWVLFAAMAVIWGIPYFMIRVAVKELEPPVVVFGRTSLAAAVAADRGGAARRDPPCTATVAAGARLRVDRDGGAVDPADDGGDASRLRASPRSIVACVPIVGTIAAFLLGDRHALRLVRFIGVALGLGGVGLLVARDLAATTPHRGGASPRCWSCASATPLRRSSPIDGSPTCRHPA